MLHSSPEVPVHFPTLRMYLGFRLLVILQRKIVMVIFVQVKLQLGLSYGQGQLLG